MAAGVLGGEGGRGARGGGAEQRLLRGRRLTVPPDRPGSAMRATNSVLARAALCPSQPRGSCAAAWPCPCHLGPAFCGADALGTATPTRACLPVSPRLGCPRQLRGLRSPPRARHAPGPRGGWLHGRAECICERPLCECDGRSTPPGPSRSLRPEQGHLGCSGVRGGRRNSERPRLPRQRCLRAHSQPKSRAVRAAPTLARGLAEWVLSEPRPGSREGASHGTSRGGCACVCVCARVADWGLVRVHTW